MSVRFANFLAQIVIARFRLADAHAKLDAAVAAAYSFPVDLTDEQILERLLALNQQRTADEKPATNKQSRVSRAKTGDEFV